LLLGATPLQADVITWDLTYEFSGAMAPDGTVTVTLEDTGANTVELTVDFLLGPMSNDQEHVKLLLLNVNPASLMPLTITPDPYPPTAYSVVIPIGQGENAFKADGDGKFDIEFEFGDSGADRLSAGEKAVFTMAETGLATSSFLSLSEPAGGHGPFYVAAHVGGIGEGGEDSGWVTDQNGDVIPEASTMILFSSGLVGLLGYAKLKARSLIRH